MQLNSIRLRELKNIPDLFGRLSIKAHPEINPRGGDLAVNLFLDSCRQRGFQAALKRSKGHHQYRRIKDYVEGADSMWWKPDELYPQIRRAIRALDLFPKEAFYSLSKLQRKQLAKVEDVLDGM